MGCNKNAIRVRVNPWNINSTRTMYAQYYVLEFNIILYLTSPIKVYVIWIIYSYDFITLSLSLFFFCIPGGTWRFCVATSHFLVTAKNTTGPAGTNMYQYGLTNLIQLLHLPCLCRSSLTFNLQDWKVEHVEIIVAPGKREGIDNHCFWFLDAKT